MSRRWPKAGIIEDFAYALPAKPSANFQQILARLLYQSVMLDWFHYRYKTMHAAPGCSG